MARKTVLLCDICEREVEGDTGAKTRVIYNDPKRGARAADLCDPCASEMPGSPSPRRGRPKKIAVA